MNRRGTGYGHSRRGGRAPAVSRSAAAPAGPPIDAFTNQPRAAYSDYRKLRTAHAGNAIRVRRNNDNAQTDIGFSGDGVDEAAIAAHVTTNSWNTVTRYDQMAGARDAASTDGPLGGAGGGVYTRIGSDLAGDFNGTSNRLVRADALGLSGAIALTYYVRFHADTVASARYLIFLGAAVAGQAFLLLANTTTSLQVSIAGSNRIFTCPDLTTIADNKVVCAIASGAGVGTVRCWHNGVELSELSSLNPANTMALSNTAFVHGASNVPNNWIDGQMNEVIVWNAYLPGDAGDLARVLAL